MRSKLDVYISGTRVGGLAKSDRAEIWFEYDPGWIKTGFPLSPMKQFDLKLGAFKPTTNLFSGLHGVFNDALTVASQAFKTYPKTSTTGLVNSGPN